MKTFTDNAGQTWTITVNVDAIKRVRGLLDVDLLEIVEGKLIERLYCDPVLLCDVVYAVCKPEADEKGVSDEEFGRAMAGDAIEQATKALLEELVNFSPSPRDRQNLGRVLETTWSAMEKARDLIEARLASGELEKAVAQALATAGSSSGAVPASPASTPDS
jgi:biotin synthase-related radical SAM superfamily protein